MKRLIIVIALTLLPFKVALRAECNFLDTVGSPYIKPEHPDRYYLKAVDTILFIDTTWCDSLGSSWMDSEGNSGDTIYVMCFTDTNTCYRKVWAPKVQVWLDSTQWRYLTEWLRKRMEPYDTLLRR